MEEYQFVLSNKNNYKMNFSNNNKIKKKKKV